MKRFRYDKPRITSINFNDVIIDLSNDCTDLDALIGSDNTTELLLDYDYDSKHRHDKIYWLTQVGIRLEDLSSLVNATDTIDLSLPIGHWFDPISSQSMCTYYNRAVYLSLTLNVSDWLEGANLDEHLSLFNYKLIRKLFLFNSVSEITSLSRILGQLHVSKMIHLSKRSLAQIVDYLSDFSCLAKRPNEAISLLISGYRKNVTSFNTLTGKCGKGLIQEVLLNILSANEPLSVDLAEGYLEERLSNQDLSSISFLHNVENKALLSKYHNGNIDREVLRIIEAICLPENEASFEKNFQIVETIFYYHHAPLTSFIDRGSMKIIIYRLFKCLANKNFEYWERLVKLLIIITHNSDIDLSRELVMYNLYNFTNSLNDLFQLNVIHKTMYFLNNFLKDFFGFSLFSSVKQRKERDELNQINLPILIDRIKTILYN